ncbi:MAG: rod shape determining protein RodA [Crocinitomicaceae bacterium]|jgi:rod shape determining protein RodA
MRKNQSLTGTFDWPLFSVMMVLMAFGLATVYSVAYDPEHSSIFSYSEKYGRQVMWVGVSLFLGMLVFLIDSDIYRKFSIPIYLITICLLVIVLFMPSINGARAWLGVGSMGIQPAEFAKIGTAILLANYISVINIKQQNMRTVLLALGIIVVPMVLILMQPDAGTFVVFTAFLFVLYREGVTFDPMVLGLVNLIPGIKFKKTWVGAHFIPILFVIIFLCVLTLIISKEPFTLEAFPGEEYSGYWRMFISLLTVCITGFVAMRWIFPKRERKRAGIIAIIAFILSTGLTASVNTVFEHLPPHQKERIELALGIFDDPDGRAKDGADYNRNHAMAAVGSGGFFGKGYRNGYVSSVKTNHVPESETDFIFCPWAEEWGFVGSLLLVALYLFMMLRIILIAERQRSSFNRIYAYSVAVILFYHFAVNIGMNIGFAPIIGIPLPFFSYGGSSMMSFSIMMFILLKLDSQRKDVLN